MRGIQIITVLLFLAGTKALQVEYTQAKLPIGANSVLPFYDEGSHSIFLFGGLSTDNDHTRTQILRYDLASDTIEEIGKMPSENFYSGSAHSINGNIYYFGGFIKDRYYSGVIELNLNNYTVSQVAQLPEEPIGSHTTFKQEGSSLVYAYYTSARVGSGARLFECDMSTYRNRTVIPELDTLGYTSVVSGNYAYVFGVWTVTLSTRVLRVDLASLEIEIVYHNDRTPHFYSDSPAVTDGVNAYIIGSFEMDGPDTILQFSLETYQWQELAVESFPWSWTEEVSYSQVPTSVFVKNLNRVYHFGGSTYNRTSEETHYLDDIWYIDLASQ